MLEIVGSDNSLNIIENLTAVTNDFEVKYGIGYIVYGNVDNSDTAVAAHAEEFGVRC